jgi:predicted enzyme related to lactoylglutathione lyase
VTINARYVHTSIVARDWKRLAQFYERVLGCTPIPPERHLSGPWLEAATGVPGAWIRGAHLRLPGGSDRGPTLEIFQYDPPAAGCDTVINRPGLAHLAFAVEDVDAARDTILAAGGGSIGSVVSVEVPGAGTVTFAYLTDPEGNIIEVQRWSGPAYEAGDPS